MNRGSRITTMTVGAVFGFLITASGFGNYTTIHQALLFRSWYLFAVFGSAVAVAAAGLALLRRAGTTVYGGPLRLPHGPARRHHVYGAAIFGAGFGLTGPVPVERSPSSSPVDPAACSCWAALPAACGCAARPRRRTGADTPKPSVRSGDVFRLPLGATEDPAGPAEWKRR